MLEVHWSSPNDKTCLWRIVWIFISWCNCDIRNGEIHLTMGIRREIWKWRVVRVGILTPKIKLRESSILVPTTSIHTDWYNKKTAFLGIFSYLYILLLLLLLLSIFDSLNLPYSIMWSLDKDKYVSSG